MLLTSRSITKFIVFLCAHSYAFYCYVEEKERGVGRRNWVQSLQEKRPRFLGVLRNNSSKTPEARGGSCILMMEQRNLASIILLCILPRYSSVTCPYLA